MRTRSALLAISLLAASCAPMPAKDPAVLQQRILDAEAGEAAGWKARDIDAIMNAYAPNAIVLLGSAPKMDRNALRGLFQRFLSDPGFTLTFRSDPPLVATAGDLGVTVGTYALTRTDASTNEIVRVTGRHLMNWQVQPDGQWRVVRQMTIQDAQPAAN